LAEHNDLVVTIPTLAANSIQKNPQVAVLQPPFEIPRMRLKMVWSPLLQHDPGHGWMRKLIKSVSEEIAG